MGLHGHFMLVAVAQDRGDLAGVSRIGQGPDAGVRIAMHAVVADVAHDVLRVRGDDHIGAHERGEFGDDVVLGTHNLLSPWRSDVAM